MHFDVIIVGQGIAGTVLARTLEKKGKSVLLIDKGFEKSSSWVAAGMYNPIVFKRINESWMAKEFLPTAKEFYSKFDSDFEIKTHIEYSIKRIFPNQDYAELWNSKLTNPEIAQYISKGNDELPSCIVSDNGHGVVNNCGRIRLQEFLTAYRKHKLAKNELLENSFDFEKLSILKSKVNYEGLSALKLIFCQGHEGTDNPYFNYLPLQKTKGELLTVIIENLSQEDNLNKGFFLAPNGNNTFVAGSTYNWQDKTTAPTSEGKEAIEKKLDSLLKSNYQITNHTAGLRPTVTDRRPLMGLSKLHPEIGIFNGLGTKGILLAPWLANNFTEHLFDNKPIIPEANIERFNKKL